MENKCSICSKKRELDSDFCHHHEKAYQNLKKTYWRWKKAINIDWCEYLREIIATPETGTWVKEVALNLLKKEKT